MAHKGLIIHWASLGCVILFILDVAYKGLNIYWVRLGCVIFLYSILAYKGLTIYWESLGGVNPLYQIVASKRNILVNFQMNYLINKFFKAAQKMYNIHVS